MAAEQPQRKRAREPFTPGFDANSASTADADLVDMGEFAAMVAGMQEADQLREAVIKRSRDLQKLGKQAIYAIHRKDMDGADGMLDRAQAIAEEIQASIEGHSAALRGGSFANAMEEYAEALCFRHYLRHGTLMPMAACPLLSREEYLGAVVDFTGELGRYAVERATARDVAAVRHCSAMTHAIFGRLIEFDFRNGSLRKKFDSLKYNVKRLETILYELSLVQTGSAAVSGGRSAAGAMAGGNAGEEPADE